MFGGIPMKLGGYKTREVIIRSRLMMASVRYTEEFLNKNRRDLSITCVLYLFFFFLSVGFSLKFGGISLIYCGLYSRAVNN